MVKTRRSIAVTPLDSPKPSTTRVKRHSISEFSKSEDSTNSSGRIKKMSISEEIDHSPKRRSRPSQQSPKGEGSKVRTLSQSESKSQSPKGDRTPSKGERRRSASISEGKQRKQVERQTTQFRTYRMHRVRFFEYEPNAINCIACDQSNNRLALSRSDGSVEIWRLGSNSTELYQQAILCNETGTSIEALIWHNGILYRGGLDGDLIEYDMSTYRQKRCIPCHAGAIWCLALNNDETCIAAGTEEGCVVIFEHTGDGFRYMKSLQKQEERMICLAWYHTGDIIVTGGIDNIRLWSVDSGNALQRITIARQSPDIQTIVWSIAILKDMTIVSGDSRGKLTFWNGKHGTQIKMFSCHRGDILSIAVNENENQVYAAGVDPLLVQFELAPVSASSDWLIWQRAAVRAHHTHDVRAVVMMNNFVVTGGVDCSIVAANLDEKLKYKTVPLPHHRRVHVARSAKLLLLQYTSHLQLWTLGVTHTDLSNRDQSKSMLPLTSSAVNLLELRSRNEESIVCSAISSDGTWIAYCDRSSLRLFNLTMSESEMLAPKISASRLRGLPPTLSHLPIRCMQFSTDNKLFLGYIDGSIKLVELKVTNSLPQIHTIVSSAPIKDSSIVLGNLHQMQVSADGSKVATSDSNFNTLVYSVHQDSIKLSWKLPREDVLVTAMAFSPHGDCLAYTLSSHKVMEYSLSKRCYTGPDSQPSTRVTKQSHHLSVVTKVLNMQYSNYDSTLILVQDALRVRVYDTKTGILSPVKNMYEYRLSAYSVFNDDILNGSFLQYLMHFEELQEDFAVVVERTPLALNSVLPETLARKQFGS